MRVREGKDLEVLERALRRFGLQGTTVASSLTGYIARKQKGSEFRAGRDGEHVLSGTMGSRGEGVGAERGASQEEGHRESNKGATVPGQRKREPGHALPRSGEEQSSGNGGKRAPASHGRDDRPPEAAGCSRESRAFVGGVGGPEGEEQGGISGGFRAPDRTRGGGGSEGPEEESAARDAEALKRALRRLGLDGQQSAVEGWVARRVTKPPPPQAMVSKEEPPGHMSHLLKDSVRPVLELPTPPASSMQEMSKAAPQTQKRALHHPPSSSSISSTAPPLDLAAGKGKEQDVRLAVEHVGGVTRAVRAGTPVRALGGGGSKGAVVQRHPFPSPPCVLSSLIIPAPHRPPGGLALC